MEKIFVTKAVLPPFEEYSAEIRDIWDSHWLTNMGAKHNLLKQEIKEYLHTDNIELFVNGHMGLELALQVLKLQGEVITTPYTFASTTHAIRRNGLTPVFCDINPHDYTMDVSRIEALITEKTCAILPVHVYGNVCDVEAIEGIAEKYNLKVIYDACHTFGTKYKGISTANFGDVSCFSFHATKVFNTIEGGAVCFRDKALGQQLADLKNFGIHNAETVAAVGANAKMNEFAAAMGLCNLKRVDEMISLRGEADHHYRKMLSDIPGIRLNVVQPNVEPNYAYFPILINPDEYGHNRDFVFDKLAENNIYARKYFYPIVADFDCYKNVLPQYDVDIARRVGNNILTLPLYPTLEKDVIEKICKIIRDNCGR